MAYYLETSWEDIYDFFHLNFILDWLVSSFLDISNSLLIATPCSVCRSLITILTSASFVRGLYLSWSSIENAIHWGMFGVLGIFDSSYLDCVRIFGKHLLIRPHPSFLAIGREVIQSKRLAYVFYITNQNLIIKTFENSQACCSSCCPFDPNRWFNVLRRNLLDKKNCSHQRIKWIAKTLSKHNLYLYDKKTIKIQLSITFFDNLVFSLKGKVYPLNFY